MRKANVEIDGIIQAVVCLGVSGYQCVAIRNQCKMETLGVERILKFHVFKVARTMFTADKPIRHVSEDEYGRERYIENLAYAIVTGDDSDGLVVGVEGEWGSGKTSVKNMLVERLQQQMHLPNRRTHIIEFDAWMYSRSGEIVSALFSEISEGLSPRLKWYQKSWIRLSRRKSKALFPVFQLILDILGVLPLPIGVNISIAFISWGFQNLSEDLSSEESSDIERSHRILKRVQSIICARQESL